MAVGMLLRMGANKKGQPNLAALVIIKKWGWRVGLEPTTFRTTI